MYIPTVYLTNPRCSTFFANLDWPHCVSNHCFHTINSECIAFGFNPKLKSVSQQIRTDIKPSFNFCIFNVSAKHSFLPYKCIQNFKGKWYCKVHYVLDVFYLIIEDLCFHMNYKGNITFAWNSSFSCKPNKPFPYKN